MCPAQWAVGIPFTFEMYGNGKVEGKICEKLVVDINERIACNSMCIGCSGQ
jgi:hypothetical protein